MNTIGAALTEFALLGLMVLAVFVASSAVLGTLGQAPDLSTGVRQLSLGTVAVITALGVIVTLLVIGGAVARFFLLFSSTAAMVALMVMSNAGDQAPAILLFALVAAGAPTLLVAIIRLFR